MGPGERTRPRVGQRVGRPEVTDAARAVAQIRNGDTVFVASAAAHAGAAARSAVCAGVATDRPDAAALRHRRHHPARGRTADERRRRSACEPAEPPSSARSRTARSSSAARCGRCAIAAPTSSTSPLSIAQVPELVRAGRLRCDVALVQTTRPDVHGFARFGVGVDIAECMVDAATLVIAEANRRMPAGQGENTIAIDRLDFVVETDRPLPQYFHAPADDVTRRVAAYNRQPDRGRQHAADRARPDSERGAALPDDAQPPRHPFGRDHRHRARPDRCRRRRRNREVLPPRRRRGELLRRPRSGSTIASTATRPSRSSRSTGSARCRSSPVSTAWSSLSQVFSMDLTGQACSDEFDGQLYGGVSAQPDLLRATAAAPGGKPIICLASTTPDLRTSRIRPLLPAGEGVTVARVRRPLRRHGVRRRQTCSGSRSPSGRWR